MPLKNDKSLDLVEELAQTLNIVGTDKTVLALQQARENPNVDEQTELINQFILRKTCQAFKIAQKKVLHGKSKGIRVDCMTIIFILQKKHLEYSIYDSAANFRKDPSIISKYITGFNKLRETDKHGAMMISKFKAVNDQIIEFKKEIIK